MFQTDKSGKMIVDSHENYIEGAKPHVQKDDVITSNEYNTIEELMNAHTICWVRMLQAGKDSGDTKRYKSSTTVNSPRYTHTEKITRNMKIKKHKGPPVRPLCDVSHSVGHKLSYLISYILKEVNDDQPTICDSTEDMLAAIQEANESGKVKSSSVIGSMDVKALYPSLDLDFAIEVVCQEFYNSNVKINGIDYLELGLYLSLNQKEDYLKCMKIDEYCPKRKNRQGAPPKITGSGVNASKEIRFKAWNTPLKEPEENNQKLMMKEGLKVALTVIMKNHVYNFNNEMRKQKEGGAIGMDLTGSVANIFMTWWDKELLKRLNELGIKLFCINVMSMI